MLSLDSLSDGILCHLRDAIGSDLASHVALSQSCRRLRDVYHQDDAEVFWQFACFRAGFGRPKRRRPSPGSANSPSWKDLALILVNHARHCEIKSCRGANACFAKYYRQSTRSSINESPRWTRQIVLHPLYFYLHFADSPNPSEPGSPQEDIALSPRVPDALAILHTNLPTFPESKRSQYGPLCSHANASCAFATFPPTHSLTFTDAFGHVFLTVENPDGCTILDVNRALAELIHRDMTRCQDALNHYRDLLMTSGLSPTEFADIVRRDRGFLGDHEYPFLDELISQT